MYCKCMQNQFKTYIKKFKVQKLGTSLLLLFLFQFGLNAQFSESKEDFKIYVGVAAGIHLMSILNQNNYGYSELDYSVTSGSTFGGHLGVEFGKRHTILAELNYIQGGQNYEDLISQSLNKKNVLIEYMQVPIIYKFNFDPNIRWEPDRLSRYVFLGLQYSFIQTADVDWFIDGLPVDMIKFISQGSLNDNIEEILEMGFYGRDIALFEKTDYGVLFGAGIQQLISYKFSFFAEFRGSIGFKDINAEAWRLPNNKGIYKGSNHLSVGIKVGFNYYLN